jgi:hypothetical protein
MCMSVLGLALTASPCHLSSSLTQLSRHQVRVTDSVLDIGLICSSIIGCGFSLGSVTTPATFGKADSFRASRLLSSLHLHPVRLATDDCGGRVYCLATYILFDNIAS